MAGSSSRSVSLYDYELPGVGHHNILHVIIGAKLPRILHARSVGSVFLAKTLVAGAQSSTHDARFCTRVIDMHACARERMGSACIIASLAGDRGRRKAWRLGRSESPAFLAARLASVPLTLCVLLSVCVSLPVITPLYAPWTCTLTRPSTVVSQFVMTVRARYVCTIVV